MEYGSICYTYEVLSNIKFLYRPLEIMDLESYTPKSNEKTTFNEVEATVNILRRTKINDVDFSNYFKEINVFNEHFPTYHYEDINEILKKYLIINDSALEKYLPILQEALE